MNKPRNVEIDVLKGLGVFLMVFDHVGWGGLVHTYVQSFHMPLFFIVSGYLWKNGRSPISVARKKAKTIMIPYAFFSTIFLLIKLLFNGSVTAFNALNAGLFFPTDMENMPYAPALWFLPCFFLTNLLYAIIDLKLRRHKSILILAISIVGLLYPLFSDYMLPLAIEPTMISLLFVFVGERIKKYEKQIWKWCERGWVLLFGLILEGVLSFVNGSCDLRSARYHNPILYVCNAIVGTIIWWGICRKVVPLLGKLVNPITYLSRHSLTFICLNQICIGVVNHLLFFVDTSRTVFLVTYKVLVLLIVLLLCIVIDFCIKNTKIRIVLGG